MQSAASARSATNAVITGFTYIDSLITSATTQGLYSITVEGNKMLPSMVSGITANGYTVNTYTPNNGTYPIYVISW